MGKKKDAADGFDAIHSGDPLKKGSVSGFLFRAAGFLVSILGFTVSLTCLYLGMRGVLRLGGFVASGGPYAIAHPAPEWIWIMPVSIFAGIFFIALNFFMIRRMAGALLVLAWPALFCSLGWNFLEFGIHPPAGNTPAWAWLVCAFLFLLMGGIPLAVIVRKILRLQRGRAFPSLAVPWIQENDPAAGNLRFSGRKTVFLLMILLQLAAIGLGITTGIRFFGGISGERRRVGIRSFEQAVVDDAHSLEKNLHKNARLGPDPPSEIFRDSERKPISPLRAALFAVERLREKGVRDVVICEAFWIAAPLSGYLVDALGKAIIDGNRYAVFRIGIRDGLEEKNGTTPAGETFVFIAWGKGKKDRPLWYPVPGPDYKPAEGEAVTEGILAYEFLLHREKFESLAVRYR